MLTSGDVGSRTQRKAVELNLDPRTLRHVRRDRRRPGSRALVLPRGRRAGTVAKTISAYDMAVSDAHLRPDASATSAGASRGDARTRIRAAASSGLGASAGRRARLLRLRQHRRHPAAFEAPSTGAAGSAFASRPQPRRAAVADHPACAPARSRRRAQQEALGVLGVNLIHGAFFFARAIRPALIALAARRSVARARRDRHDQVLRARPSPASTTGS